MSDKLLTLPDASEYYWLQRAREADRAKGEQLGLLYNTFDEARTGWRLLAFAYLAWELAGIVPLTPVTAPTGGSHSLRWSLTELAIRKSVVEALLKAPPVLGGLIVGQDNRLPANLWRALQETGKGPRLGDSLTLCTASGVWFYDSDNLRQGMHPANQRKPAPASAHRFYATLLRADGPPETIDPSVIASRLCHRYANTIDRALSHPMDLEAQARWEAETGALMWEIRQAVWQHWQKNNISTSGKDTGHLPEELVPLLISGPFVAFPVHGLHDAMRRGLFRQENQERISIREDGEDRTLDIHTGLHPTEAMTVGQYPVETLRHLLDRILKMKDTGLLKTHLDLMNQAFQHEGQLPAFWYDLTAALDRLGYKRQSHGAYNTKTLREHYARVRVLGLHWVSWADEDAAEQKGDNPTVYSAPYWTIEARKDDVELGKGFEDEIKVFLGNGGRIHRRLFIRPGLWWPAMNMKHHWFPVPQSLLVLAIDGAHEVNRIALRLAAELAVWESNKVRTGQKTAYRQVGELLECTGIAAYEELASDLAKKGNRARRLRNHLAGEDGLGGALDLLREMGAFLIDIEDDSDFFHAGRGWLDRFWAARVRLTARGNQITS